MIAYHILGCSQEHFYALGGNIESTLPCDIVAISQKSVIMSLWMFKSFLTAVGEHGRDEIDDWYRSLPPNARAKFRTILEHLRDIPHHQWPWEWVKQLRGPAEGHGIFEIRFKVRNIVYRPLGFFGPAHREFTFLIGAREQGDEFVPRNAIQTAITRKDAVLRERGRGHELWL